MPLYLKLSKKRKQYDNLLDAGEPIAFKIASPSVPWFPISSHQQRRNASRVGRDAAAVWTS